MASRVFFEQLKAKGDKLLRHVPPPPRDLSPPPQVAETLHMLVEVLNAYEATMESSGGAATEDEQLASLLSAVLDPLIDMCERSAEALTPDAPSRVDDVYKMDPTAHKVYLINALSQVYNTLGSRPSTQPRARVLAGVLEGHAAALVGGEVGRLLAKRGLSEVVDRLRLYQQQGSSAAAGVASPGGGGATYAHPASDPALSLEAISEAMRNFFVLISSPDALPEFSAIQVRPRCTSLSVCLPVCLA